MSKTHISICFLLIYCLISGCAEETSHTVFQSETAIPVEVTMVEPRTVDSEINLYGVVEAAEEIVVNVEFAAPVEKLLVDEGQKVHRGQPLLELDTSKLELSLKQSIHLLEQATAELKNAERSLSRLGTLVEKKTIARQQLDDAMLVHDSARARVQELESRMEIIKRDLEKRFVRSPTDAIVGTHHVQAGQSILAFQTLMTLHAVQGARVAVFVGENQLPLVRIGNKALVQTVSGTVESFVHSIASNADPLTGNYKVKLSLGDFDSTLKPGMTAHATVETNPVQNQLLIPDTALVAWNGHHAVYVTNGDIAERRLVDVVVGFDNELIVDRGLSYGDQVVVSGVNQLTHGSPLNIIGAAGE